MSCNKCRSVFHFAKDCPEERQGRDSRDQRDSRYSRDHEVNLSWLSLSYLFVGCASSEKDRLNQLIEDSDGYAILDSGCANTVCGIDWFQKYVNNLSVIERGGIKTKPSNETFTFGDGKSVLSMRKVILPHWAPGEKASITADIVDCKIPLLLSRKSMSQVKMKVDFGTEKGSNTGDPKVEDSLIVCIVDVENYISYKDQRSLVSVLCIATNLIAITIQCQCL